VAAGRRWTAFEAMSIAPNAATFHYQKNRRIARHLAPWHGPGHDLTIDAKTRWTVSTTSRALPGEGSELSFRFTVESGQCRDAAVGLCLDFHAWSTDHYLLMPAAVYDGNRFPVAPQRALKYLPTDDPHAEPVMTPPVPRLNVGEGDSLIQLLTGDLAFPAVAIHDPHQGRGLILLLDDRTPLGLTSIRFVESDDRRTATLELTVPGVRELVRHHGRPSTDRGARFSEGDHVELRLGVYAFDCADVPSLYGKLFDVRNVMRPQPRLRHDIPFAAVYATQHRKYNEQNWVEKYGYYSVGMRESRPQDWQTGWVGGPNALYPLMTDGDALTRRRGLRELDFIFDGGQGPSGLMRSNFHEGHWNDGTRAFLRYSGDSLYFLTRILQLIERRDGADHVAEAWRRAVRRLADAFCRLWERYGQFGHYGSTNRDELLIGGTCAASTAIGGLALASSWLGEPRHLEVAKQAGDYYHQHYIQRGLTNAGPGDILQCPDSESCFGLLESFVTLYEVTGDPDWLQPARDTAHQAATWVTNYDFAFPPDSTFGKLDMLTTGTVWANIQNKHSAPGICTLSGCSLLKLFRATGDRRYLELIREIAHAIPQYMSREDRPIVDGRPNQRWPVMPPGWINERVNMSDWEVRGDPDEIGVGEIFGGSTWSEAAMLLTAAELPGIYAQSDTGLLCVLDHVTATWTDSRDAIIVHNPTPFDANVKLLIETAGEARQSALGPLPMLDAPARNVPAQQKVRIEIGETDQAVFH